MKGQSILGLIATTITMTRTRAKDPGGSLSENKALPHSHPFTTTHTQRQPHGSRKRERLEIDGALY